MTHPRMNVVPWQSSTMTAVGVWESRGPDTGVIADDRPRDSNGLGAPASPTFRFSAMLTGRPQAGHFHSAPVDTVHGPATAVHLAKPKASRVPVGHHFPECFQLNHAPLRNGTQAPAAKPVTA